MSYFRNSFASFQEFQREGLPGGETLGREELEMLRELESDDDFETPRRLRYLSPWD